MSSRDLQAPQARTSIGATAGARSSCLFRFINKIKCLNLAKWRRRRDSNPRYPCGVCSFSKRVPSASRPRLRWMLYARLPLALTSRRTDNPACFRTRRRAAIPSVRIPVANLSKRLDSPFGTDYTAPTNRKAACRFPGAQIAQLVEHATENRSVPGSNPGLGTILPLETRRSTNSSPLWARGCARASGNEDASPVPARPARLPRTQRPAGRPRCRRRPQDRRRSRMSRMRSQMARCSARSA